MIGEISITLKIAGLCYECHLPDLRAAIHSRYSSASSLSFVAAGSASCFAFSSQSAAFFSSSAMVAPAGINFMAIRLFCTNVAPLDDESR